MRGDRVVAADGTEVVLVDIGLRALLDVPQVRVWDVVLPPGGHHPWHLHHNPYVVLSVEGSTGRMDWLDGSPSRPVAEHTGGAVFRPVSPVHCLTNTGDGIYRNRLVELKDLGENRPEGVHDVGSGARSTAEDTPGPVLADGRTTVLTTDYVTVQSVEVAPGTTAVLDLGDVGHVLAELDVELEGEELDGSVSLVPGGRQTIVNASARSRTWFVVSLDYLRPDHPSQADRSGQAARAAQSERARA